MTPQVIRYARIQLPFKLPLAQEELKAMPVFWRAHHNMMHYDGEWTVLPLRAPGGDPGHISGEPMGKGAYADTPFLDRLPALKALLDSIPAPVLGARLLRLAPGSRIKEHRDPDLSYELGEARLHFPLFTHPEVDFVIGGERVHMREGECWYINANLPHRVSNPGPGERIHLVVDCTVTEDLKRLFEQAALPPGDSLLPGYVVSPARAAAERLDDTLSPCHVVSPAHAAEPPQRGYSTADAPQGPPQAEVIRALRRLNTETASRMADQMEEELNAVHTNRLKQ